MWAPTLLGGMNVYRDRERVVCGIHNVIDSGGQIWSDEHRFLLADNSYALVIDRFVAHDDLETQCA